MRFLGNAPACITVLAPNISAERIQYGSTAVPLLVPILTAYSSSLDKMITNHLLLI